MRENITSVLFDMDGVLIDSQPMHYEADIRTLARFGVRVTVKDVEKYAELPMWIVIPGLKEIIRSARKWPGW